MGSTLHRNIGDELVVLTLGGKRVQETPNVDLITREVAADGMSINGETHLTVTSIADHNHPRLRQKSNFFQAVSHVNSFSNNNLPERPTVCLSSLHASSRVRAAPNSPAVSANSAVSPSRTGKPSAPTRVETTARPAAQASKIFRRVPLPVSSGTTATRARASSPTASATAPTTSILGSLSVQIGVE